MIDRVVGSPRSPFSNAFEFLHAVFCAEVGGRHRLQLWWRLAADVLALPRQGGSEIRVAGGSNNFSGKCVTIFRNTVTILKMS